VIGFFVLLISLSPQKSSLSLCTVLYTAALSQWWLVRTWRHRKRQHRFRRIWIARTG